MKHLKFAINIESNSHKFKIITACMKNVQKSAKIAKINICLKECWD